MDHKTKVSSLLIALIVIILAILVWGLAMRVSAQGENRLFMPLVFCESCPPPPTPTNTPKPPTPTPLPPTATPAPVYMDPSTYEWVYIGRAENVGEQIEIIGIAPGFCYDVVFDHWEDHIKGKLAVLRSREITPGYWWCTSPPWNPDAVFPPPQFPPPPVLPPEFGYGEIFSKTFDFNAAVVCGIKEGTTTLNCLYADK